MNRRDFLRMMGGAGLAAPGLLSASGCAPVLTRTDAGTGLSLCYATGDVTHENAMIWLRAEPGSEVALQYGTDPAFGQFSLTAPTTVDPQADFTAQIALQ